MSKLPRDPTVLQDRSSDEPGTIIDIAWLERSGEPQVDGDSLRAAMRQFATGVTIVTTKSSTELHGMTVSSFTAVSLSPPLISISLMPESRTSMSLSPRSRFNVHVVAAGGGDLCRAFATAGVDKYAGCSFVIDDVGIPVLDQAVAIFQCEVAGTVLVGDHRVVFGLVRGVLMPPESGQERPLIFWNGQLTELPMPTVEEAPATGERLTSWSFMEWESDRLVW